MENLSECLKEICQNSQQNEEDQNFLQPFAYVQEMPGKNIRAKLVIAFNYWMNVPVEKLASIGEIVKILHNSSLLVDDIQDDSCLRRGFPVAHSIYGVSNTVNAAKIMGIKTLEMILQLGHPDAEQIYTEQMLELHRGQGMDIYWRDNLICPTENEYKRMIIRKTGGLFLLAIRLMQLFSECDKDFTKLTAILGLYFQIRDDYCNLTSIEYSESKSFCEDLTEGKFSFPIIYAVNNQTDDNQILHMLMQRTKDVELKKEYIRLLEDLGSFEYTRNILKQLDAGARAEVERIGPNEYITSLLDELFTWN